MAPGGARRSPVAGGRQGVGLRQQHGGTPHIELSIVYRKLHEVCGTKGLEIVRNLIGRYVTSLEMEGLSIARLKMDDDMIELWDQPVKTPRLRRKMRKRPSRQSGWSSGADAAAVRREPDSDAQV